MLFTARLIIIGGHPNWSENALREHILLTVKALCDERVHLRIPNSKKSIDMKMA
jgi:hypothetical protein